MPFPKKVKAPEDINPGTPPDNQGESATENKNKKNAAAEVREIYAQKELLEEKENEIAELKKRLAGKLASAPDDTTIQQLQSQVDFLTKQIVAKDQGGKLMFRPPTAADTQEDSVTYTARSVYYIVASYKDNKGVERIPPHKLIAFEYAASDIKKDGKEDTIKNFSQYTTNLKTEIEFLEKHPFYGITFGKNLNEMMAEDTKETEFKMRTATLLAAMTPETIFDRARDLNIPNWRSKSPDELRIALGQKMTEMFKKDADDLQRDIVNRRVLASQLVSNKE